MAIPESAALVVDSGIVSTDQTLVWTWTVVESELRDHSEGVAELDIRVITSHCHKFYAVIDGKEKTNI